jgi:hypothetical protein
MKLPVWLSTKARREARAEHEATQIALEKLSDCLLINVPDGMNPAPEVRASVRKSLDKIDAVTAHKVETLVDTRRADHHTIVLMVWDVLERRDSNAALNRIADNFDYITQIGWGCTGAMPGFVLRAFPIELVGANLTTDQQRALLRLEDSRWHKNFTPEGGNKSSIRSTDIKEITEVVLSRPYDVERIIDLATTRKPKSAEHYFALLDSDAPEPLKDGEL